MNLLLWKLASSWVAVQALPSTYDSAAIIAQGYCVDTVGNLSKLRYENTEYVFPIMHGAWQSPIPVAFIMQILMNEQLGVETSRTTNYGGSQSILVDLAGCATYNDCMNGVVQEPPPKAWAAADVWTTGTEEIQLRQPQYTHALGPIGYISYPALYTYERVMTAAAQDGFMLEWWETLKLPGIMNYFSNYTSIDVKLRENCDLLTASGRGGVDGCYPGCHSGNSWWAMFPVDFQPHCVGGWFLAPACSANLSSCIPVVLWNPEWNVNEWVNASVTHNLPLAITWIGLFGAGLFPDSFIPSMFNTHYSFLYYWWLTDRSLNFFPLPSMVQFAEGKVPPMLNISQFQSTWKVVWKNLKRVDSDVFDLWSGMFLSQTDITGLLDDYVTNPTDSHAYHVACNWLQQNEVKWRTWMKNESDCPRGSYYNSSRPRRERCVLCPPGKYADERQLTQCKDCYAGLYVPVSGTEFCVPCRPGRFSSNGSSACTACIAGRYQYAPGTTACIQCPGLGEITAEGASSLNDCVCAASFYRPRYGIAGGDCKECPSADVIQCPEGSREEALFTNNLSMTSPQLQVGYWTSTNEPMIPFECVISDSDSGCQGQRPGNPGCKPNLIGVSCSQCPQNWKKVSDDKCTECAWADWFVVILFIIFVAVMPTWLIPWMRPFHRWRILARPAVMGTIEILIELGQTVACLTQLRINWSQMAEQVLSVFDGLPFKFLALDPVSSFPCLVSSNLSTDFLDYVAIVVLIPGLAAYAWCLYPVCSRLMPVGWGWHGAVHAIFKCCNMFFVSQVFFSVWPFQCYSHPSPNKKSSLIFFPSTMCWESQHISMFVVGIFSLLLCIAFFAYLCWETRHIKTTFATCRDQKELVLYIRRIAFMIEDFTMETYYWNIIAKVLEVVLGLTAVPQNCTRAQITIYVATFTVCMYLWSHFEPYKVALLNLSSAIVFGLLVLILVAGITQVQAATSFEKDFAVWVLLCGIIFLFFVLIIGLLAVAIVTICLRGRHGELLWISQLGRIPSIDEVLKLWSFARKWQDTDLEKVLGSWQAHDVTTFADILDNFELEVTDQKQRISRRSTFDVADANCEAMTSARKSVIDKIQKTRSFEPSMSQGTALSSTGSAKSSKSASNAAAPKMMDKERSADEVGQDIDSSRAAAVHQFQVRF